MKWILVYLMLLFTLFISIASVSAQAARGKIAGRVLDADSKAPLPGVNVIVEGTGLGAATDNDGYYYILNLPPGRYKISARMIGYATQTRIGVQVNIGRTTEVDFELTIQVLEGEEIIVTAERKGVRKDVSNSVSTVTADVIELIPADNMEELMTNVVGISTDMMGLVIRGGYEDEINFIVDGLNMNDERNNRPYTQINMGMVSEVEVLTGGFDAEYGNARSGIVNVVTKKPGSRYTGSINYKRSPAALKHFGPYAWSNDDWWDWGRFQHFAVNRSDSKYENILGQKIYHWYDENDNDVDRNKDGAPDFWGWNKWAKSSANKDKLSPENAKKLWDYQHRPEVLHYGDVADYVFEGSIGGPLFPALSGKVIPVLPKITFSAGYREEFSAYPWQLVAPGVKEKIGQFNIFDNINPNMYLTFSGILSRTHAAGMGNNDLHTYVKSDDGAYIINYNVYNKEHADRMYAVDNNSNIINWKRNNFGLKFNHVISPSTFYEVQLQGQFNKYKGNPADWVERNPDGTPRKVFWLINTKGDSVGYPSFPRGFYYPEVGSGGKDQNNYYLYGIGEGRAFDDSRMHSYNLKSNITGQINRHHQIKAGLDLTYSDINEHRWVIRLDSLGTGIRDDNKYHIQQMHGALYIQDKMEFEGFVLNVGLRGDFFVPESPWYDMVDYPYWPNQTNSLTSKDSVYAFRAGYPKREVPVKYHLSPRIGVSHPITENSKLYFNYGHFTQIPDPNVLYWNRFGTLEYLERVGNAFLKMPVTVAYEIGFEQNIFNLCTGNISAFYKDQRNQHTYVGVDIRPVTGYMSYNASQYRDIKGYEIRLDRRRGRFFNFSLSLETVYKEIGYTTGKNIAPLDPVKNDAYIAADAATRARVVWQPVSRYKLLSNFHTPVKWGPKLSILGPLSRPLGGWSINISYLYKPGPKFHYDPTGKIESHILNWQWMAYQNCNLKIEKKFTISVINAAFYLDIYNLFNHKNFNLLDRGTGNWVGRDEEGGQYDRIFAAQDRSWEQEFKIYMMRIKELGLKPGDEVEYEFMPKRTYITYMSPRDFWFGIKFYF